MAQGPAQQAGHDSFQASIQNQLAQGGGANSNKTGFHELIFGRIKTDHGYKPQHMGTWLNGTMPKTPGMPSPGGSIRSRGKPIDKGKLYKPAPGGENAGKGGHNATHVNPQFKHLEVMGVGGWQNHPAFMGLDPMLGGRSPFQGMSLYAGRMSPHAMPNFSPVTQVFGQGSSTSAAFQAHAGAMAAQQAARGRTI